MINVGFSIDKTTKRNNNNKKLNKCWYMTTRHETQQFNRLTFHLFCIWYQKIHSSFTVTNVEKENKYCYRKYSFRFETKIKIPKKNKCFTRFLRLIGSTASPYCMEWKTIFEKKAKIKNEKRNYILSETTPQCRSSSFFFFLFFHFVSFPSLTYLCTHTMHISLKGRQRQAVERLK